MNITDLLGMVSDPSKRDEIEAFYDGLIAKHKSAADTIRIVSERYKDVLASSTRINTSLIETGDLTKSLIDAIRKMEGEYGRVKRTLGGLNTIAEKLVNHHTGISNLSVKELSNLAKESKIKLQDYDNEIKRLLNISELQLKDRNTEEDRLDYIQKEAEARLSKLETDEEILKISKEVAKLERKKMLSSSERSTLRKHRASLLENETAKEVLGSYLGQREIYEDLIKKAQEKYELEKSVNKTLGLTGAVLGTIGKLSKKLGMGHISDDLSDINNKLQNDTRAAIEENEGKALGIGKRFSLMFQGVGGGLKMFAKGLVDPLFLLGVAATAIGKILSAFLKVNEANVRLQRLTGQNAVAIAGLNNRLVDSTDFLNTAADITEQLGFNAQNVFTTDTLAGAAEMKNLLGLSSEEAGGIALITQAIGGNIDQVKDSIVDEISAFNKANRSAINQGTVLKDVAKTSLGIKAALGGNPKALTQAATAARRLGMELAQVDRIADSLMDFESSIQNELEAQLLIGKSLNLGKARELALNNDLAGLAEELFNNSADIAEFGRMNRIQQEAYAKALGMSKDELAKIAYNRALEVGLTKEQAEAAANVRAEDMERMAVQESLNKSLAKLAQAFAPILESVVFVIEWITKAITAIASFTGGVMGFFGRFIPNSNILNENLQDSAVAAGGLGKALGEVKGQSTQASMGLVDLQKKGVNPLSIAMAGMFTVVGINKTSKFFKFLKNQFTETTQIAKNLINTVKNIGGKLITSPKGGGVTETLTDKAKSTVTDAVKDKIGGVVEIGDKTKDLKPGAGTGLKSFLVNLGKGLRSLGANVGQALKGVVVLSVASVGAIAPLVGALHLLKNIDPAVMLGFSTTLASLGMTLFVMGKLGSGIMKDVLATGLMSVALIPLTGALKNLSGIDLKTVLSAGAAIGIFSAAVFGLGALMSTGVGAALFGFGLIAITGLGVAIGVLGVGLKSVAEGIAPFTSFIKTVAPGMKELAGLGNGVKDFLKSLKEFPTVGSSLQPFFSMLEKYNPELLAFASSLNTVAISLANIAASAASISTERLQEVASITAAQTVSPVLSTQKGKVEEGISSKTLPVGIAPVIKEPTVKGITEEKFVAKIDELITEIRKGGNVYLDSNKVGYALTLGATKLA